jgi:hypothetical protein
MFSSYDNAVSFHERNQHVYRGGKDCIYAVEQCHSGQSVVAVCAAHVFSKPESQTETVAPGIQSGCSTYNGTVVISRIISTAVPADRASKRRPALKTFSVLADMMQIRDNSFMIKVWIVCHLPK